MATIIEGHRWTLTDKAAEYLAEKKIIKVCPHEHIAVLEVDLPIYHLTHQAMYDGIGLSSLYSQILEAEKAVE